MAADRYEEAVRRNPGAQTKKRCNDNILRLSTASRADLCCKGDAIEKSRDQGRPRRNAANDGSREGISQAPHDTESRLSRPFMVANLRRRDYPA